MPGERKRIVAVLPRSLEYSSRLLEGAVRYANEHRYIDISDVAFSWGGGSPFSGSSPRFDGALAWLSPADGWAFELLSLGIAVVNVNSCLDGIPSVAFGSKAVVEAAVEHLAGLQVAELAYVGFKRRGEAPFEERWSRLQQATRRRALPLRLIEWANENDANLDEGELHPWAPRECKLRLRRSLSELTQPAGVWCEEDFTAVLVCEQVRELGLRIPQDVAVLGLGDFRLARCCIPPLSSIPQPGQVVGYEGMRLLTGILSGAVTSPSVVSLPPPPIVHRESTGGGEAAVGYLQKARELIATHACEGITVATICRMTDVSKQTLTSRFRDVLGRTPGDELRRVRLEHAKRYLLTTNLTIAHISGLCGFGQQNKFGNFFKRQTGLTPSQFRRVKGDTV